MDKGISPNLRNIKFGRIKYIIYGIQSDSFSEEGGIMFPTRDL